MHDEAPILSPDKAEFGNHIVEVVRSAVKEHGWENAAFLAMNRVTDDCCKFTDLIPAQGISGQTITTTEEFEKRYQLFVQGMLVLTALIAEKTGTNLKSAVEAVN
jgi:hypothetical protein